jgi:hypothetical protein
MSKFASKVCALGLGAAAAVAMTTSSAGAGSWEDRFGVTAYQYAVKFVCGFIATPGIDPLTVGDYATAINIVNANEEDAPRIAFIVVTDQTSGAIIDAIPSTVLAPFTGEEIDCDDIIDPGQTSPSEPFVKGFVIVQSCRQPLDITAVYQVSRGGQLAATDSISQSVEQILSRKIRLSTEDCTLVQ